MNAERRKEIEKAVALMNEAQSILESCRDDEQDYHDNMPESLQNGEKGETAQAAIDGLENAIGQIEEAFLFLLPRFDTGLDEIDNDAVGARAAGLGQGFHPAGDARGETYALTDGLFGN